MTLDVQFKLKTNPYILKFLHENSHWYKYLNRNPKSIYELENEMKEKYKFRTSDKIEQVIDNINMITKFVNALK